MEFGERLCLDDISHAMIPDWHLGLEFSSDSVSVSQAAFTLSRAHVSGLLCCHGNRHVYGISDTSKHSMHCRENVFNSLLHCKQSS